MDFDRRHYRAAKALVVIIPVLGFTYILTLLGPSATDTPTAYTIFQAVRAALLSTHGAVITLPYCYLNTEVQSILTIRWKRWRMSRIMESECQARKSSPAAHSLNGEVIGRFLIFNVDVRQGGGIFKMSYSRQMLPWCHTFLSKTVELYKNSKNGSYQI